MTAFASKTTDIPSGDATRAEAGTGTLDLARRIVEFLAYQSQPTPLTAIAKAFDTSKATVYRHLQTLIRHGFARRDPSSGRYKVGIQNWELIGDVPRVPTYLQSEAI